MIDNLELIYKVLERDERLLSNEGDLLKNKIYELAMKMDKNLLKILAEDEFTKETFFADVDGMLIFDKVKFGWVVDSKDFLPDSYTHFRNKVMLLDNDNNSIRKINDVVLSFPFKDCILEGGQSFEDEERDEIFYNEVLARDEVDRLLEKKVISNGIRYTKNGSEPTTEIKDTDNLIIKGNNLLAISSLLENYRNKIKCVYIDPPYNPKNRDSNTFAYNNTFNRSSWLVFMKNRLEVAKELLTDDGVLICAIDKNEQPYLQVLLNEIFVEYNTDCITVVHNPRGAQGTNFSYTHEYAIFVYPKGKKAIGNRALNEDEISFSNFRNWGGESLRSDAKNCFYPVLVKNDEVIGFGDVIYDENIHPESQTIQKGDIFEVYPIDTNGIERKWRYARQSAEDIKSMLKATKGKNGYEIMIGKNFGTYKTVWADPKYDANEYGTRMLTDLVGENPFSYPKSLYTVIDCVNAVVQDDKNAIILDFFAGSGTTGHAVQEINRIDGGNRKFILTEQMYYIEPVTLKRNIEVLKKLESNAEIVYLELKELSNKFIEDINSADSAKLDEIYDKLDKNPFVSYRVDFNKLKEEKLDFVNLSEDIKKRFLLSVIDKNMLYVNYSDMEDETYSVTEEEKMLTNSFYKK